MTFPPDVATFTLTGTYTHPVTGLPLTGYLVAVPSNELVTVTGKTILPAIGYKIPITSGVLTPTVLPLNDNATVSPAGWVWEFTEVFPGQNPNPWTTSAAAGMVVGGAIDISVLPKAQTVPSVAFYLSMTANLSDVANKATAFGNIKQDATSLQTGVIQLNGDISGTAESPTVAKIQGTAIQTPPGLTNKFLAGDGSWQTITVNYPVVSVFGRSGAVSQAVGDYSFPQISGSVAASQLPFETVSGNIKGNGAASLGTSGKLLNSDHVHPLDPWVFSVLLYGAKGDGQCDNTGSINSATPTIVTITSGKFNAATDVGKLISLKNAYNLNNASGITTASGVIASVQSTNQVTVTWSTGAPTQTASGLQVQWATDDTVAIQNCINAAWTYMTTHGGFVVVYFGVGAGLYYGVGGVIQSTDFNGNAVFHSQLMIPVCSETGLGMTMKFKGQGGGGNPRYWNSDLPQYNNGIQSFGIFTSSTNQTTSITAGGNPSVLGGPTGKFGYGVVVTGTTPTYSNICVEFEDFTIRTLHSNSGWTYTAANLFGCARMQLRNVSYGTNGTVQFYKYTPNLGDFTNVTLLSGGLSIGLITPSNGNNAEMIMDNVTCDGGYTFAAFLHEHIVGAVMMLYCWSGLCPVGNYNDSGSGAVSSLHGVKFSQACVEGCTYHINVIGAGSSGLGPYLNCEMDTEGTVQIRDAVGSNLANTGAGVAAAAGRVNLLGSPSTVTISTGTGAGGLGTGLEIVKQTQRRGVWSTPPALVDGTSVQNTSWRPATWFLSGGTNVTTVAVSSLSGGVNTVAVTNVINQAAGALPNHVGIPVPSGGWIKVTTSAGVLPTVDSVVLQ